jgi:hypothetical protein
MANFARGWNFEFPAWRYDQPPSGLHVERDVNSTVKRKQQFVDQNRQLWQWTAATLDWLFANRCAVVDTDWNQQYMGSDLVLAH